MRVVFLVLAFTASLLCTTGCHSAYVETTVTNRTAQTIEILEVDYPSASFGTQNLAPGAAFHYRFKILGSGQTKLLYTDIRHKDHVSIGPTLSEGQEGTLTILITAEIPQWSYAAHSRQ